MLKVTVIKSSSNCTTCSETEQLVSEIAKNYKDRVEFRVITNGTSEAGKFGIVTTPVVVIENKIYSMGKPVIKEKVEGWIKKELATESTQ
ncbi:MAG: thioredoxin family protein [Candidatus Riflebacteria bacterium]|nr:thioredoxin family protein [Candidatus Riflebacteria bacterium]